MRNIALLMEYGLERPRTVDEVLRRIAEVSAECGKKHGLPYAVDVLVDNGRLEEDPSSAERMSVGVGDGEWMLFFYPGDGSSLGSLGNRDAAGTIWFEFGDWTEMSRKYLIPKERALAAIKTWLETGKLGNELQWTMELF
jgi:hypothetical protein